MLTRWFKACLRWFNLHPAWRLGRVRVWHHRLRPPTFDRWLALWLHRLGRMGVADRRLLERSIQPGMTVVDIGANQGLYTLLFSRLVGPKGRVLAFEPDDLLCAALRENLQANAATNAQSYHLALGSAKGTLTLYRSLLNSGDNRLRAADRSPRDAVPVQIERLDHVLTGTRIDFVKMDVQGWEMEVLRGMEALFDLPTNRGMIIYFEFWPQGLLDAGADPLTLLHFLSERGFVIHHGEQVNGIYSKADLAALIESIPDGTYTNLLARRLD